MSVGGGEVPRQRVGDSDETFSEYVLSKGGALLSMAIALTGNRADAEDLVQVALAKTYRAWDKIADRAAVDGYVRRAMVNTHISWWRRRRLEEYPTDELPDVVIDDETSACDMHEVVARALNRLPTRMRTAVILRYFDDMTEPEIAAALGVSLGTVKSTVSRAVAKLRVDSELGGGLDRLIPFLSLPKVSGFDVARIVALSPDRSQIPRRWPVRSTMMDIPLTVTSIMRVGTSVFGGKEAATATGEPGGAVRRRGYAETGERAARLANALRGLGVDADQRVGTFMWNNAEHLEAYLAIPCMGAVLHTLNIRLACEQVGYIATHAEDYAVIVDASLVPLFSEVLPHAPGIKHVIVSGQGTLPSLPGVGVHGYEELLEAQPATYPWPSLDETTAAAMCYTSGTTGNPKGVVYSHRSTYLHSMAPCLANTFGLSERDRVLPIVPMFHANAWGLPYAALLAGAGLLFTDRFMQPDAVAGLISAEQVTVAGGVPTIWSGLLAHARQTHADLSSLRVCVGGGSAVPRSLLVSFEKELGVSLVQAWGMTETSPLGSVANPPTGVSEEEAWDYRDTQGRLCFTLEGRLTGDDGEVLPSDGQAVGEVEVRGPWVTGSYYRDDDPGKFRDGWLRTGDVGSLDAGGFVRLTDRAKDVIKSGGEWISSMELENLLMAHPAVAEAAVIGVTDEKWGERPLAAVVLRPDAAATAADLREFLATKVVKWQVPERWCFIDQVPRTSVGKFSKVQMREAYRRGDYDVIEVR